MYNVHGNSGNFLFSYFLFMNMCALACGNVKRNVMILRTVLKSHKDDIIHYKQNI